MSSSRKTNFLKLNMWQGSDIPEMLDFNTDNVIIDNLLGLHLRNGEMHITEEERNSWNNPYSIITYAGDGLASRNIALSLDFTPKWGIIFGVNKTPAVTDFDNTSNYNYFAVVTNRGSMQGASLNGKTLTVSSSPVAVLGNEHRNMNEAGVNYVCIFFA